MTLAVTPVRRRWRLSLPPADLALVFVPFLLEAVGVFWPSVQGIIISTTEWNGYTAPESVGLRNYSDLLSDPVFLQALLNTVIWTALFGGISFGGGLAVALLLQPERRGVGLYRAALFLPVVFSMVVTSLAWSAIFQPDGILNGFLRLIGLDSLTRVWLGDPATALYAVMIAGLWREIGYIMVLFIAGLKGVDPATIEAARVDGTNVWQRFIHVVFPQLRGVTMVIISVIVIDSLRSFDIVYAMTGGGPFHSSELLSTYMFSQAFQSRALGYSSAIAVVIFLLAVGVIITYLVRAFSDEEAQS